MRSRLFRLAFALPPVSSYAYISSSSIPTWEGKRGLKQRAPKKPRRCRYKTKTQPRPPPPSTLSPLSSLPQIQQLNPELSAYRDRRFEGTQQEFDERLRTSTTLYVGNLSFYTSEEQLLEAFSKAGDVLRIVMGLDKQQRTPCGFAFGE